MNSSTMAGPFIDAPGTHDSAESANQGQDPATWSRVCRALPRLLPAAADGDAAAFVGALAGLPALGSESLEGLTDADAHLLALDVFMVEAAVRRHGLAAALPPATAQTLASTVDAVARRCGIPPILSYPLYIRVNPPDIGQIRRFTPLESEFRFIRMHRVIEDVFDRMIGVLDGVLDARDRRAALRAAMPAIREDFRLVNRTMAGFRSPERIDRDEFVHGFRPYFDPVVDAETGRTVLEGPSGLQSPTYRLIAMQVGYRDSVMDGWTERIARCHDLATRSQLALAREDRDAGRSLTAICDAILGGAPDLPHVHPSYAAHIPALLDAALRCGYVSPDIMATFAHFALPLGEWPAEAPAAGAPPAAAIDRPPSEADRADLAHLAEIEAMLFGMHLEHATVAATQIGAVRGTGGTSGVEFLLVATFRRAFPKLWVTGLGAEVAGMLGAGELLPGG